LRGEKLKQQNVLMLRNIDELLIETIGKTADVAAEIWNLPLFKATENYLQLVRDAYYI
jgi:hypothetical protein